MLESQITKSHLRSHKLDYIPPIEYFEPCSHLDRFKMKTQTTNLTWFIPKQLGFNQIVKLTHLTTIMHSFVGTYIIIVITHTKHNMKTPWIVHHVQPAPLFGVMVPLRLSRNVELVDGSSPWMKFWFWGEKTNKPNVNLTPIINCLSAIFQILNQMWITMKKHIKISFIIF